MAAESSQWAGPGPPIGDQSINSAASYSVDTRSPARDGTSRDKKWYRTHGPSAAVENARLSARTPLARKPGRLERTANMSPILASVKCDINVHSEPITGGVGHDAMHSDPPADDGQSD